MTLAEIEAAFAQAIAAAGLGEVVILADGKLHRFKTPGDHGRGKRAGWAWLHADGAPHGTFGDWRLGLKVHWRPDNGSVPKLSRRSHGAHHQRRKAEQAAAYARAATKAAALFDRLPPAAADHPYLQRKQIPPGICRATATGSLAVPVFDVDGKFTTLQYIRPDGDKRFMAGGRAAGGCCTIGTIKDKVIICEGYATAASIHQATGLPVIAAFSAGNISTIA